MTKQLKAIAEKMGYPITIISQFGVDEVFIGSKEPEKHNEYALDLFSPLENPAQALEVQEHFKIDLLWNIEWQSGNENVRARGKTISEAILNCAIAIVGDE